MKKITLLCALIISTSVGYAQNAPIDFETGGNGASWTWTTFENDVNPALEIVANPSSAAPNTSSMVAKFTAKTGGQPWAGCESMHGSDIGTFTLVDSTSTIRIMVYKSVISDVGIKLVENAGGSLGEIKVANTKINQWEELTFDFSSREGIAYDQIVFFMDFDLGGRTTENICYFDNVTFGKAPVVPAPMVAAPDPTFHSDSVISMFSNVYTDVTVNTWRTGWSNGDLADIQVAGNDVKKYSNLTFVGIETVGANVIDATNMTHINLDVWSPNSTVFKIKLVDFGADGNHAGGDDTEHELSFNAPAKEEWVNYNIPLSDFSGLTDRAHLAQMILVSEPVGSSILYVDNVFYSKGSSLAEPMIAAPDPTYHMDSVISLFSNVYTDVTVNTWRTGWSSATLTDIQVAGNDVKKYSALDFVGIEATGTDAIDATNMEHVNFDIWTPNSTTLKFKLVDFGADGMHSGGDDSEHEVVFTTPALDSWVNYHIPLTDFTGLTERAHINQIIFASQPTSSSIIYLDNLFFSKETTSSIVNKNAFSQLDIYPNPATDKININIASQNQTISNFSIMSITGKTISSETVNNNTLTKSINTSSFESGIYLFKVNTNKGTYIHKIVIE